MGNPAMERVAMSRLACLVVLLSTFVFTAFAGTNEQRSLILVVGAPGEDEFQEAFATAAGVWKEGAQQGGLKLTTIGEGTGSKESDRTLLLNALTNEAARPGGELWLVFLGHGTFDGRTARFNLRGPDISPDDIATALKSCERPVALIQCASGSGPFLNALSGPGRVVITATRSGHEINVTRFGQYIARAIADPAADLDKDGQTSLLEAYLMASRQVEQFYKEEGRLASEHALLDDNGDGLGTPAEWFRGVRAVRKAADGKAVDGVRAHQLTLVRGGAEEQLSPDVRARRDELEQQLSTLRDRKPAMPETEYYEQLEAILLETARLYHPITEARK
jgi:hypothetical protein